MAIVESPSLHRPTCRRFSAVCEVNLLQQARPRRRTPQRRLERPNQTRDDRREALFDRSACPLDGLLDFPSSQRVHGESDGASVRIPLERGKQRLCAVRLTVVGKRGRRSETLFPLANPRSWCGPTGSRTAAPLSLAARRNWLSLARSGRSDRQIGAAASASAERRRVPRSWTSLLPSSS